MTTRSNVTDDVRASASAKLAIAAQRRADADKALDDLRVAKEAETLKTARLRGLRLAHQAEQDKLAAEAAAAKKPAAKAKKRAVKA